MSATTAPPSTLAPPSPAARSGTLSSLSALIGEIHATTHTSITPMSRVYAWMRACVWSPSLSAYAVLHRHSDQ
mgnify:CR=1 FL=1